MATDFVLNENIQNIEIEPDYNDNRLIEKLEGLC